MPILKITRHADDAMLLEGGRRVMRGIFFSGAHVEVACAHALRARRVSYALYATSPMTLSLITGAMFLLFSAGGVYLPTVVDEAPALMLRVANCRCRQHQENIVAHAMFIDTAIITPRRHVAAATVCYSSAARRVRESRAVCYADVMPLRLLYALRACGRLCHRMAGIQAGGEITRRPLISARVYFSLTVGIIFLAVTPRVTLILHQE